MSSYKKWSLKGLCGRCLLEFIDWRYSQSYWYFRPSFVNCCPSNFLSGSTLLPPSPLPCVNKYTVYTYTVCKGGRYGVLGLTLVLFVTSHAFGSDKSAVVSGKWVYWASESASEEPSCECYAARQTVFYIRRNISLLFWVTSVVLSPRVFHFHLAHQVLSHQRLELIQSLSFLLAHSLLLQKEIYVSLSSRACSLNW